MKKQGVREIFFKKNKGAEKSILEDLDSSLPLGSKELKLILKIVKIRCNFSPPASDFKGEPLAELASAGEVDGRNSRLGKYLVAIDHNLGEKHNEHRGSGCR